MTFLVLALSWCPLSQHTRHDFTPCFTKRTTWSAWLIVYPIAWYEIWTCASYSTPLGLSWRAIISLWDGQSLNSITILHFLFVIFFSFSHTLPLLLTIICLVLILRYTVIFYNFVTFKGRSRSVVWQQNGNISHIMSCNCDELAGSE